MRGDGLELAGGRAASSGLLLSVKRSTGLQNCRLGSELVVSGKVLNSAKNTLLKIVDDII